MASILATPVFAPIGVPERPELEIGPWSGYLAAIFRGGNIASNLPVDVQSLSYNGQIIKTYFNDYYNRIWVLPSQNVNFGEIGGIVEQTRLFWNSFLQETTVAGIQQNIENVDSIGLNVSQTIGPLATVLVRYITDESGPEQALGEISYTFSIGGIKVVTFEGRRSLRWPTEDFKVNWGAAYEVEIEYRTDIFVSRNGKEQRRAQRRKPRKRLTYQSIFDYEKLRRYNAILANRQTRTFTIPEETKTIKLSASANAGDSTLTFDEIPAWVVVDTNYMLLLDSKREVVRVESISANTVTLSAGLQNNWFAGDYFVPVHTVRMATSISAPLVTNSVATVAQQWEVEPTTEPFENGDIDYDTYEDLFVFAEKHNWGETLDVQKNYNREEVDFSKGRVRYFTPVDFPNQIRTSRILTDSVDRMKNIENFFMRMRGRAGEFWIPTWERDLEVVSSVSDSTDRILCEGRELFDYYPGDRVFRNIMIQMVNGQRFYRRIESYQLQGENTEVQVTEILPGLELGDIEFVSFLVRARFASDTHTTSWLTREVPTANIAFQVLEDI
jgi:hypothetical protein